MPTMSAVIRKYMVRPRRLDVQPVVIASGPSVPERLDEVVALPDTEPVRRSSSEPLSPIQPLKPSEPLSPIQPLPVKPLDPINPLPTSEPLEPIEKL